MKPNKTLTEGGVYLHRKDLSKGGNKLCTEEKGPAEKRGVRITRIGGKGQIKSGQTISG